MSEKCDCSVCTGKDSIGDLLSNAMQIVERGEYGMISVLNEMKLTYTYGRSHQGKPELLITGLAPVLSEEVIHRALHVAPGQHSIAGHPVMLIPAETDQLRIACYLAGGSVKALQIIWPDSEGRWPWNPAYSGPSQIVLGEVSAVHQNSSA